VAAIGERARVAGFALAGVHVLAAEDSEDVRQAWRGLPPDVALVIVTPVAAEALGPGPLTGNRPLVAVMPP
jgi:vacuolar-type H+-ATPase subunit F/Vma7